MGSDPLVDCLRGNCCLLVCHTDILLKLEVRRTFVYYRRENLKPHQGGAITSLFSVEQVRARWLGEEGPHEDHELSRAVPNSLRMGDDEMI
jgi:hypothetical protein